jgi:hypothetical protein
MIRTLLGAVTILIVCLSNFSSATESCFAKGNSLVNLGLGLAMEGPVGVVASYECAVHDLVSVGGEIGYSGWSNGFWSYSEIPFAVRGAFHPFNLPSLVDKIKVRDKFDVYGGLSVGYDVVTSSWSGPLSGSDATGSHGIFSLFIGGRYYMNPHFGFYAEETGGSFGWLNGGVVFKF